ncbi:hypothetical protein BRDID11002_39840 [Bradyrhizobium diazoefficiens]
MSLTTSPIFSAPVESSCTVALVRSASLTARLATSVERVTWREISATELDSSSAAAATVPTLPEAFCEAAPTVAARDEALLAVAVIDCAVLCMPAAAEETERTIPLTLRSKSLAISSIALRRSAAARSLASASVFSRSQNTDRIVLEDLNGRGHCADLVAAADAGNVTLELAVGEILHAHAEQRQRTG